MNPINILFFALVSFMGKEDPRIVSRKVSVTINPVDKTIEMDMEDLFSIIVMPEDSIAITEELQYILEVERDTEQAGGNGLTVEQLALNSRNELLDATLKISYTDPEILEKAGIYFDAATGFSMINILEWNIHSTDAVLDGNYWKWPADKPATFTIAAFENIPEQYQPHQQRIFPYWKLAAANP